VIITGTNLTGATAVMFGGLAAGSFTVNSATQITATSPAGSAGTVDVTVTTAGGTSTTSSADKFTVVNPGATDYWTGAAGDGLWSTSGNWSLGHTPGATDNAVANLGSNPTITFNTTATIGSLTASDPINFTGGSLTINGTGSVQASTDTAALTITGGTLTVTGTGTIFTAKGTTTLSGVSLYASSGGQMSFPTATSYTGNGNTTITATGSGSLISLTDLATFAGGGGSWPSATTTSVLPTSGGEIDLAGAINTYQGGNSNIFTVSGSGSKLGVAGITGG
jgi:hypothetical protein